MIFALHIIVFVPACLVAGFLTAAILSAGKIRRSREDLSD